VGMNGRDHGSGFAFCNPGWTQKTVARITIENAAVIG
jgi:hypothetical protein